MTVQALEEKVGLKTVLVVDDEAHILTSVADLLEEDFSVLTAQDAETALALLRSHEVAVILSDQRMPGMHGDEFLSRAQQLSSATRILITAYADLNALVNAVNHGQIYGYISKPWNPMELKITVKKAADHFQLVQALLSSEERFRTVFEHAPVGMTLLGEDRRITGANRTLCDMLGFSSEELVGRDLEERVHPDDRQDGSIADRLFSASFAGDRRPYVKLDRRYLRKNGDVLWAEVTATLLKDRTTYGLAMIEDITERKEAEMARGRLASVLGATPDFVAILSASGKPIYVNGAAREFLCVPSGEEAGAIELHRAFSEEAWERIEREALPAARTKGPWTAESTLVGADGDLRPVSLVVQAQRDADGELESWALLARDLSEIKALEAQVQLAQKMDAVGKLAGGVAHDFNNVLTVISGYARLLRAELSPDDPKFEDTLEIEKSADRATALTGQLLAFSRRQVLQPKLLEVSQVFGSLEKMLRWLVGANVELRFDVSPEVGRIKADRTQLEQVLINLAVNARDAMRDGGRLTVSAANADLDEDRAREIAGGLPGQFVVLSVSDTGVGMDSEVLSRIFEPFFTTKEPGKGTGLGLSTVYGIVKQSGGFIDVWSEPGKGTRFDVHLPRVDEEPGPGEGTGEEGDLGEEGSETILLVEDEASVRLLASRVLRGQGYTVIEARDAKEALRVAGDGSLGIDLLLTDVVLPGTAGTKLARSISEMHPEIKILFMSGYAERVADEMESLGGETLLLMKPFSPPDLTRHVRRALGPRQRG